MPRVGELEEGVVATRDLVDTLRHGVKCREGRQSRARPRVSMMDDTRVRTDASAKHAVVLEYATVLAAVAEALAALVSGALASSVALLSFGSDSVIEVLSAAVVLSQLRSMQSGDRATPEARHRSHRLVAILFFALVGYVLASAIYALSDHLRASENILGFVVCGASCVLMPGLAALKGRTSAQLARRGEAALARLVSLDAKETVLCALLSASTLLGIALTASFSWWWADPLASLAVVYFAFHEGLEAWKCSTD
jgi:divalent metal cation (Fe/Co/Zn/Cd) transporter